MLHLAPGMDRLGTETAFDVLARAAALQAQGKDIISLGIGQPDFKTPPHIGEAAIKAIKDGHHGYTPANGIPALRQAVADKTGLARYGNAVVPLDEALVEAVVDLSGRPHLTWNAHLPSGKRFIGAFDVDLTQDFFQALVNHARCTLHVNVRYGRNLHHVVEAIFKAVARALRAATAVEGTALPSTKGLL